MASIDVINRLEDAISRALTPEKGRRGNLGFVVNSNYTVFNPFNRAQYYVRVAGFGITAINHLNRVPPVPDLPVIIRKTPEGDLYIDSIDHRRLDNTGLEYQTGLEFGLHSHARFSGLEFDIDNRLLSYMRAEVVEALTIRIQPGVYWNQQEPFFWNGAQTADLSPIQPGSGLHRWVLIGINTSSEPHALAAYGGPAQSTETPLTMPQLLSIYNTLSSPLNFIPSEGVILRGDQAILTEGSFESIKPLLTGIGRGGNGNNSGGGDGFIKYILDENQIVKSGYQANYVDNLIIEPESSIELGDKTSRINIMESNTVA